jgi:hypothetical protein
LIRRGISFVESEVSHLECLLWVLRPPEVEANPMYDSLEKTAEYKIQTSRWSRQSWQSCGIKQARLCFAL